MEVHHPQHPTHKKKWSEYLLEFFMLFVAVTLGFFAENIREHIAEENKAKDLIKIVAKDLRSDLEQLNMLKSFEIEKIKFADSIKIFLKKNPKEIDQKDYYRVITSFSPFLVFNPNDKSIIDAEAKGYFFKEENKELAALIKQYNFWLKDYNQLDKLYVQHIDKFINEIIPQITEPEIIDKVWRYPPQPIENKIGIAPVNAAAIRQTSYFLSNSKMFMDGYLSDTDSLSYYANKAIHLIEKEN